MDWLANLKEFRRNSNETYRSLSEKTKIPQTTIEKLFSGRTADPKLGTIKLIVESMGYTVSQLLGDDKILKPTEEMMLEKYRRLDTPGRNIVNFVVAHEYDRVKEIENARPALLFSNIYYDFPVSAGTGEYMDVQNAKMIRTEEEPPARTSFVLRVSGDSMEPDFFDHDLVYVNKCERVEVGEIGIFVCAGNVYMKQYTKKGLRSLNPRYNMIPPSPDMVCLGKVLGTVSGRFDIIG